HAGNAAHPGPGMRIARNGRVRRTANADQEKLTPLGRRGIGDRQRKGPGAADERERRRHYTPPVPRGRHSARSPAPRRNSITVPTRELAANSLATSSTRSFSVPSSANSSL